MTVYLLRHAIAEDHSESGRDRDRVLTTDGIAKLQAVLRVARRAGVAPRQILSSPYVRTTETAAIARRTLRVEAEVSFSKAFTPDASPLAAWEEIRAWQQNEPLLVVTHEPLVSALFSLLLGVSEEVHDFKKSGLAMLDVSRVSAQPAAMIRWILTPTLAEAIARETGH